jgi:hypothetical protein
MTPNTNAGGQPGVERTFTHTQHQDNNRYRLPLILFRDFTLSGKGGVPSPKGVELKYESHRLPHSFHPVGDGWHVIPIDVHRWPLGYQEGPIEEFNPYGPRLRRFWLPEGKIDRRYLILNSFLWVDLDALCRQPSTPRAIFAVRCYRAMRPLGFIRPEMSNGAFRNADFELRREIQAKEGFA